MKDIVITNINEITPERQSGHSKYEYYKHEVADSRGKYEVSSPGGDNLPAVAFYTIPPGKSNSPFYYHINSEKVFYVISGNGVLETFDTKHPIKAGDIVVCPVGKDNAHKITNISETESLVYLDTNNAQDIAHHQQSDKTDIGFDLGDDDFSLTESEFGLTEKEFDLEDDAFTLTEDAFTHTGGGFSFMEDSFDLGEGAFGLDAEKEKQSEEENRLSEEAVKNNVISVDNFYLAALKAKRKEQKKAHSNEVRKTHVISSMRLVLFVGAILVALLLYTLVDDYISYVQYQRSSRITSVYGG
jgi:uncharacterized cupin superfamily protein